VGLRARDSIRLISDRHICAVRGVLARFVHPRPWPERHQFLGAEPIAGKGHNPSPRINLGLARLVVRYVRFQRFAELLWWRPPAAVLFYSLEMDPVGLN
jgi:hypothetical protein